MIVTEFFKKKKTTTNNTQNTKISLKVEENGMRYGLRVELSNNSDDDVVACTMCTDKFIVSSYPIQYSMWFSTVLVPFSWIYWFYRLFGCLYSWTSLHLWFKKAKNQKLFLLFFFSALPSISIFHSILKYFGNTHVKRWLYY